MHWITNTGSLGMSSLFTSAQPCFKFSNPCSLLGAPEKLKAYLIYLCHFGQPRADMIKTLIAVLMVSFDRDYQSYTWSLLPLCCYLGKWYDRTYWTRSWGLHYKFTRTCPSCVCSQVSQSPSTAVGEPTRWHHMLQQQCTGKYVYTTPKRLLSNVYMGQCILSATLIA